MKMLHRLPGLLMLMAAPLAQAGGGMPAPAELACRFEATADAAGHVMLKFTLRNTGPHELHLLRWGSPFEGAWFAPFVRASTAQGELPFQGALRKRGDPSAQDYLRLAPGQALSAELPLADAYALPASGPVTLRAAWRWHDVMAGGTPPRPRDRHQGLDQACGELTLAR
ncbi:hypothetical protein [Roseateles sp.]|uniref:hypothetical protein n=1 Tax=Roseateles sp. TaxID=1971397 RepID=UPI002DFAEDC5|nr:hypothetical protein [Roseateles sp.]